MLLPVYFASPARWHLRDAAAGRPGISPAVHGVDLDDAHTVDLIDDVPAPACYVCLGRPVPVTGLIELARDSRPCACSAIMDSSASTRTRST
jgi:hypothetical protein